MKFKMWATRPFCLIPLVLVGLGMIPTRAYAQSPTFTTVYSFCSVQDAEHDCLDGVEAFGFAQGYDGNFYGGSGAGGAYGGGTVFRLTPAGVLTTLYDFCQQTSCPNGSNAYALLQGPDGNFYGTMIPGLNECFDGCGTIFKITPAGELSTLYQFCSVYDSTTGVCLDGAYPAVIILGSDGNLYGTTDGGYLSNSTECGIYGCGTIFRLTLSGTLTTLYRFCAQATSNCTDGAGPNALIEGSDGNFYGHTYYGGSQGDYGTIFQLTPSGSFTTIYNFCSQGGSSCTDGMTPIGGLVEGSDSALYGTTDGGGSGANGGTLFKLTPNGTLTTLYSFCNQGDSACPDGSGPDSLLLGSDANFYGTTDQDGRDGPWGTAFRFTTPRNLTTLFYFCGEVGTDCSYGAYPTLALQGTDGGIYGSATLGSNAAGLVFRIAYSPALPAPVQLSVSSASIKQGSSVALSWKVLNAFSNTMQQCYLFSTMNGTTMPLGKVSGSVTDGAWSGSMSIIPAEIGTITYALTCGGVESGLATLTVAGTSTTTAIVANPNPPTVGQPVTLTAQVRRTSGGGFATGAVKFQSGSTLLGTSTLNGSGVATFTASTNGLPPGSYPVTATYEGDSADAASTSPSLPVTLGQAPTSVTLTANPTSVTPPANVVLTATVTRSASGATGTPTGTVTFSSGTVTLATVNVNGSGVAAYTASSSGVPAGQYPVTAKYNGDAADAASTSAAVDVTVK